MCSLKLSSLLHSTLLLQTLQLRFLIRNCVMKNVIPEQAETYNKVAAFPSWQHNPESEQNGIRDCIECSRMFIYLLALHLPLSLSHSVCEAGLGRGVSEISMRFDGKTPSRRAMTAEQSRGQWGSSSSTLSSDYKNCTPKLFRVCRVPSAGCSAQQTKCLPYLKDTSFFICLSLSLTLRPAALANARWVY